MIAALTCRFQSILQHDRFGRWRSNRRRSNHRLVSCPNILAILFLTALPLAGGCASVYPAANPKDPVAVYICNYGFHSSLLLPVEKVGDAATQPAASPTYVEYCYCDWNFTVENRDWVIPDWPRALLFSRSSGLGRRFLKSAPDGTPILPDVPSEPLKWWKKIYASRERVAKVDEELDRRYESDDFRYWTVASDQFVFVRDTNRYWIGHNCNDLTADLLRELGCDVRGESVLSGFTVVQPGASGEDAGTMP